MMKRINMYPLAILLTLGLMCGCQNGVSASLVASSEESGSTHVSQISQISADETDDGNLDAVALISDIPTNQYFSDEPVDSNDLETILMAGINTPSAMNGQPWHFSAVTNPGVLQQIAEDMSHGMGFSAPPSAPGVLPEDIELPDRVASPEDMTQGGTSGEAPTQDQAAFDAPSVPAAVSKAGIGDVPLAIIISCKQGSELDAGLACQNMSVTANLLGYGTKIVSSPTIALNGEKQNEYRELLGIPEEQSAVAILLVGCEDTTANEETVDAYAGATQRNPMNEVVTFIAP